MNKAALSLLADPVKGKYSPIQIIKYIDKRGEVIEDKEKRPLSAPNVLITESEPHVATLRNSYPNEYKSHVNEKIGPSFFLTEIGLEEDDYKPEQIYSTEKLLPTQYKTTIHKDKSYPTNSSSVKTRLQAALTLNSKLKQRLELNHCADIVQSSKFKVSKRGKEKDTHAFQAWKPAHTKSRGSCSAGAILKLLPMHMQKEYKGLALKKQRKERDKVLRKRNSELRLIDINRNGLGDEVYEQVKKIEKPDWNISGDNSEAGASRRRWSKADNTGVGKTTDTRASDVRPTIRQPKTQNGLRDRTTKKFTALYDSTVPNGSDQWVSGKGASPRKISPALVRSRSAGAMLQRNPGKPGYDGSSSASANVSTNTHTCARTHKYTYTHTCTSILYIELIHFLSHLCDYIVLIISPPPEYSALRDEKQFRACHSKL